MNEENPFAGPAEELEQFCWRDAARHCSSECVAYDEKCEADPIWNPCILINIQRAQAKSFANIAAEMKRVNDKKDASDEEIRNVLVAAAKKRESEAYAEKVKDMDAPPPKITT